MNDVIYLKKQYKAIFKKELHLNPPKTFNEKIQWLKLYNRNPKYTDLVDKYAVKEYVASVVGEKYIIPTYGVWNKFEDIDFEFLPSQFVLKCTHDSGGLVICRNKQFLDLESAKKKISSCLQKNFYYKFREWAYKDVKPRIIAEKYMEDTQEGKSLIDYKFFCFNAEPKFLYVSKGLEHHPTAKISFFDLDGKLLPFHRNDYKPFTKDINLPNNYSEMLEVTKKLALDINAPFVRIDLYSINGSVYFSEITFYPNGGFLPFEPSTWDEKIGEMLKL